MIDDNCIRFHAVSGTEPVFNYTPMYVPTFNNMTSGKSFKIVFLTKKKT